MRVTALRLRRYRAFKEPLTIEIAPLTILIGCNGSGKSVIARLPLLIAQALSDAAEGPLDLWAGDVDHAISPADLPYSRLPSPFSLGVDVSGDGARLSIEVNLQYILEKKALSITRFYLNEDQGRRLVLDIEDESSGVLEECPAYRLTFNGSAGSKAVQPNFRGLFPRRLPEDPIAETFLKEALTRFQRALPMPAYLGPFRQEPSRQQRIPGQGIRTLGSRGERTPDLLADDRLRQRGTLADDIREWFRQKMGGQMVDVDITGEVPKLYVEDLRRGVKVQLADTGAGFAQLLPVVAQNFAVRSGRLPGSMLIVEQPELHLHPAAHGDICDLMLDTVVGATRDRPLTCLVETHSEQFITRLRRRIAEGKTADGRPLEPQHACLISVGHRETLEDDCPVEPVRVIHFDRNGDPDAWPAGVFGEAFQDLTKKRQAIRERGL